MSDHPHRGRPSLRLPTYDYSLPGGYFVTICTQDRLCLFGRVTGGELHLNEAGHAVLATWENLPQRFPGIILDAAVMMPNHLHGIVLIQDYQPNRSLGRIIGTFKSLSTNAYIAGVRDRGWQPFPGRLWQDNYFEHVIRDDASLDRVRAYILANPSQWEIDPERPQAE